MNVYCPKCEAMNRDTDPVCSQCGHPLAAAPVGPPADVSVKPAADHARRDAIEIRIPLGRTAWAALAVGAVLLLVAKTWTPGAATTVSVTTQPVAQTVEELVRTRPVTWPPVTDVMRQACSADDDVGIQAILYAYAAAKAGGESRENAALLLSKATFSEVAQRGITITGPVYEYVAGCHGAALNAVYGPSSGSIASTPAASEAAVRMVADAIRQACSGMDDATIGQLLQGYSVAKVGGLTADEATNEIWKPAIARMIREGYDPNGPVIQGLTLCNAAVCAATYALE